MPEVAPSPAGSTAQEQTTRLPAVSGPPDRPAAAAPVADPAPPREGPDYEEIRRSPEFVAVRRRLRRFVFPMSLLFLAWYLCYVLLAAFAHDLMSTKVVGAVNVGIVLGLLQFASTLAITAGYLRFARRRIDPAVAEIRCRAEVRYRAEGAD
ncbi:Uncharacterized membrane protein, DUF485 family [Amycolatopsis arida]|uniref:Uncharacterized membrane protein, DUF485 family n=1 Tax=Amycolatopsis arida TaxID=587909 RepID=A0A1I5VLE3_9PSEU|nr:DUF485 domain-containing protein [Amycolatopsis arida]TDX87937.1 uncharacterized membrane protein (DUF485 family) [Amycolatopsis arida]SFQ08290.1 Uncharacterized membrane protein, DUF485 family [Amycolatopsis arida]